MRSSASQNLKSQKKENSVSFATRLRYCVFFVSSYPFRSCTQHMRFETYFFFCLLACFAFSFFFFWYVGSSTSLAAQPLSTPAKGQPRVELSKTKKKKNNGERETI
jgi:hypothetical protein